VGAVIERFPLTISPIRDAGTRIAIASNTCLRRRHASRLDVALDITVELVLGDREIIVRLKIQPESGGAAEVSREAHRRRCRERTVFCALAPPLE